MPSITIHRTAHYEILLPDGKPKGIWMCLHGYGQLAERFVRRLKPLQDAGYIVIAPEGLNRFYWQGYSGKVAATWMTKHDRFNEITDYVGYLDLLFDKINNDYPGLGWHTLGFSQGVATLARWIAMGKITPKSINLWAGHFPEDLDMGKYGRKFKGIPQTWLAGDEDQFLNDKIIQEHQDFLRSIGLKPKLIRFKGGHDIHPETLREVI
ncbi:MAG: putative esterase [Sphingobacteriales bacterium]|jgi:predicted esterase